MDRMLGESDRMLGESYVRLVSSVVREEDRITDTDIANVRPPQLSKENADTENFRSSQPPDRILLGQSYE